MSYYGYCLYDPGQTFHGTGTVTLVSGSTALVGVGTTFTTQLVIGSVLQLTGGYDVAVATITNNTTAVLQIQASTSLSGVAFDYNNPINVESISPGIFPPKPTLRPWVETRDLGSGLKRALGKPLGSWQWGYLSQLQRDALRHYCPAASNRIYLRTRFIDNLDAYLTFEAVVLWPDEEQRVAYKPGKASRENFVLAMRDMVTL